MRPNLTIDTATTPDVGACRLIVTGLPGDPIIVTGSSKRTPGDKPSEEIATLLAVGRAFEALGLRLQKKGNGLVKHRDDLKQARKKAGERRDNPLQSIGGGIDGKRLIDRLGTLQRILSSAYSVGNG